MKHKFKKLFKLTLALFFTAILTTACTDNDQTTSLTSNNQSPTTNSNTQTKTSGPQMGEKSENSKIISPSSTKMHSGSTSEEGKTGPGSTTSLNKGNVARSESTDGSKDGGDSKVGAKKEAEGSDHDNQAAQIEPGINQVGNEGKKVVVAPEHGNGSAPESKVNPAVPTAPGSDDQKTEPGVSETQQHSGHMNDGSPQAPNQSKKEDMEGTTNGSISQGKAGQ